MTWDFICKQEAMMPQSYSVCEHCHRQVTPGHSCPHDPNRLRDDLTQNSAARAGHEADAAAVETVAGILNGGLGSTACAWKNGAPVCAGQCHESPIETRLRDARIARSLSQNEVARMMRAPDGGGWLMPDGATVAGQDINDIERGRGRDIALTSALASLLIGATAAEWAGDDER